MVRVQATIAAMLLSSVLALSGCSSDPQPKVPEPSSSPATPSATAPTLPTAATKDSEAGAIAFVRHYIALLNYASDTGDVEALKAASGDECEGCASYIDLYKTMYENGGYLKDSGWTVQRTDAEHREGNLIVFVHVDAPDGVYRESSSSPEKRGSGGTFDLVMIPERSDGRWILKSFERVAKDEAS